MFRFSKPKGPGFGISKAYYITTMVASHELPSIQSLINPGGEQGAVAGFGVPLAQAASSQDLALPIKRGAYAVASPDKKTVVRCLVVGREETGFNPEAFVKSALALHASPEIVDRLTRSWAMVQLTFETFEPMVKDSLTFILRFANRVADATDGVIADPLAQRYFLPHEAVPGKTDREIEAFLHVATHQNANGDLFTRGMAKFNLPDFLMRNVSATYKPLAERLLDEIVQKQLDGKLSKPKDRHSSGFTLALEPAPDVYGSETPCYALCPDAGRTMDATLGDWAELVAR